MNSLIKICDQMWPNNQGCVRCKDGYFKAEDGRNCEKCHPSCKTCLDRETCITCAENRYDISFVRNRDLFCTQLNKLLNERTHKALKDGFSIVNQQSNYDEIIKLKDLLDNGIITQEEFDAKKKELLGL